MTEISMNSHIIESSSQLSQAKVKQTALISAISFIGNAKNRKQQDALFVVNKVYQSTNFQTEVITCENNFCVAVADGVASSPYAEKCSKAIVQNIADQWASTQNISMRELHQQVSNANRQYIEASATVALIYRDDGNDIHIRHIGDSRVYHFQPEKLNPSKSSWNCLTQDHNILNQEIAERIALNPNKPSKYQFNQEGMASFYYALTECLMINPNTDDNPMPNYSSKSIKIKSGDCLLVCTDGIHDLVPAKEWHNVTEKTELQLWLDSLKQQVYQSKGNAYDNGTAILIRFQ